MKNSILIFFSLLFINVYGQVSNENHVTHGTKHPKLHTNAQKDHENDSTESVKIYYYTGVGISLGNETTNFKESAYLSLENGLMYKDFFGGIVLGNGDLRMQSKSYFYEAKAGYSFPIGILNGTTFFGYGRFFGGPGFIDYGSGLSYTHKKVSFGVCYSNWAGNDYITPSITFNW